MYIYIYIIYIYLIYQYVHIYIYAIYMYMYIIIYAYYISRSCSKMPIECCVGWGLASGRQQVEVVQVDVLFIIEDSETT